MSQTFQPFIGTMLTESGSRAHLRSRSITGLELGACNNVNPSGETGPAAGGDPVSSQKEKEPRQAEGGEIRTRAAESQKSSHPTCD